MIDLKQAVERLEKALWPTVLHEEIEAMDVALVLSALSKAEADNCAIATESLEWKVRAESAEAERAALEAKLAFRDEQLKAIADHCDRMYPMPDGRRADDNKRPIEQHVGMVVHTLTSHLAALRPLVMAAHYRLKAYRMKGHDRDRAGAECLALADVVEAADRCRDYVDASTQFSGDAQRFDTALAKLAKAVGAEGEK